MYSSILRVYPHLSNKYASLYHINNKFSTTSVLLAEPPRKKRRVDPALLRVRVERKILRLEREIQNLERQPRKPIPIEYQLSQEEISELESRPGRTLEDVGTSESAIKAAYKLWCLYRNEQTKMERRSFRQVESAQQYALDTLKQVDEKLYNQTVALDDLSLIPYTSSQIKKQTAPNPNYKPPDGSIKTISKEWII